jgi:hypothetical protein
MKFLIGHVAARSCRASLLAFAGLLASSGLALAQDVPPDADAGAPQAPPADPNAPPADPNAPPAAAPPAPPVENPPPPPPPEPAAAGPAPVQLGLGVGPIADTTTEPKTGEGGAKPLVWRGTSFTWNQAVTTTEVGIGRDNIGDEDGFYGWDFLFTPNLYVVDLPKDKVNVFAELGWHTELTNGDTVDERETLFKDMQLGARYNRTIWENGGREPGEYVTSGSFTTRLVLPTSDISRTQGRYLVTAFSLGAKQQIKLLGKSAAGLNNLTVGATGTYSHLFSRATQPTLGEPVRERTNASGNVFDSDALSSRAYDVNRVTLGLNAGLPIYKDLAVATQVRLIANFRHDFDGEGCDAPVVNEPDGCVDVPQDPTRTTYHPMTTFDVALTYPIVEVVDLALGYSNETLWIGEDGQRRGIFYSPGAQFYLDITANLDAIYSKITNRDQRPNASRWAKAQH